MKDYVLDALNDLKQKQDNQAYEIKELKRTVKYHQALISFGEIILGVLWIAFIVLGGIIK
ncbi:hypothetical protein ACPV36_05035 [Photobacterium damselae]|uniref:hypothetical protein n=1 Tax=Photobacterium damselae TaxID=38293 RepID=UPI0040696909